MNNIKNIFSIRDLENLSGVKAHTIRIWEKRYNVLEPMRTETNIRLYDLQNLQKLLNITLLHQYGYKISNISKYPAEKIPMLVREIISEKSVKSHAISAFKIAMLNFDQKHFLNTYNTLLSEKSFREIFNEVFIPLLVELGLLWQSGTISPAQEHFISNLIKQKLVMNIEKAQLLEPSVKDRIFVLFLPENEIHELGLMYANYEILMHGYQTIYLGESVPMDNLAALHERFKYIVFVTYMTVKRDSGQLEDYIRAINDKILVNGSELWFSGCAADGLRLGRSSRIKMFGSLREMLALL